VRVPAWPAVTSAQAVAARYARWGHDASLSSRPNSEAVNERAARYFQSKHGLETVRSPRLWRDRLLRNWAARAGKRARRFRSESTGRKSRFLSSPAAISRR